MSLSVVLLMMFMVVVARPVGQGAAAGADQVVLQNQVYEAYVTGNIPLWERTIRQMEAAYSRRPVPELLYDILLAQYGLIGYYLGTGQNSNAQRHLEQAEAYVGQLSASRPYSTTALVFQSAFLGFRISLRPLRAVQLGPRSYRLIDQAIEADPAYARGWIEKGNISFYTPSVFGGNKGDAIAHYQKAIQLLEINTANNHRWLYLSTLVALANAQKETGDVRGGIQTLEKALRDEPRFSWVRDELLPAFRGD